MNSPSTAILCIVRNEQPFAAEWLEYHLGLGFDHIYLVSTDDDFSDVQAYYRALGFGAKVSLHHFDQFQPGWQQACYASFFSQVQEDWLLVLDLDEFLYLNTVPDIKRFLGTFGDKVNQIQFPWLNLFSGSYFHETTFGVLNDSEKYASNHVKSLVRSRFVTSIGIHYHRTLEASTVLSSGERVQEKSMHDTFVRDPSYYANHPFILHFASRGYLDTLNRIIGHRFFNDKTGEKEKTRLGKFLTGRPSWSDLPNRFLLMKVLKSLPEVDIDVSLPSLKSTTNVENLLRIFHQTINTTVDLGCRSLSTVEQKFDEKFALDYKLNQLELGDVCDPEQYLKCKTQLEYIAQIRKNLCG